MSAPDHPPAADLPPVIPTPVEGEEGLPTTVTADFAPPADIALADQDADGRDPHLRDSVLAQELYDRAVAEAAAGNEEGAVVHFLRASKLAEAAREWYLTAVACHRVGDIFYTPEPPYDLVRAFRMYHRAVAAYQQCGHFDEARRLSYHVAWVKLRQGGELRLPWRLRAELFVYWAVAGFGYRPARLVGAAVAVVFAYGLAYWALGGVVAADGRPEPGFWPAVYFSGTTFSTVGYGDLLPAPHVRGLALTEGAVGAFATSFFVVVLANRLRH